MSSLDPSSYKSLVYEVLDQGQVALLTFNRPHKMNCVNLELHRELCDAFERANTDDKVKSIVITGKGSEAFCSGADLTEGAELAPISEEDVERSNRGEFVGMIGPTRRTDIDKPILAAVNGLAYAGGFEWALLADIIIAEEHATFGVTCRRWNVGLGDGGTQRLPRKIGLARALDLILTGRVIDAKEAHFMGLVSRIVPKGASVKAAVELASALARLPQPAMRCDKRSAIQGMSMPLDQALLYETRAFNQSFHSPGGETMEGVRKFRERDHEERRKGDGAGHVKPGGVRRSRL